MDEDLKAGLRKLKRVFISYAHEDRAFALRLAEDLDAAKVPFWIDMSISPGKRFSRTIEKALKARDTVVLVVSPHSRHSDYVDDELHFAKKRGMPIVPVVLSDYEEWMLIGKLHYADFRGTYEYGLQQLSKTELPVRTLWWHLLVLLRRRGLHLLVVLLALVAITVAVAVFRYRMAPSATDFSVIDADPSSITLLVKNSGGRPSTLLYPTFHIDFGPLPIPPRKLVAFGNETSSIPGHSEIKVQLTVDSIQLLNRKPDGSRYRKDDVDPMVRDAKTIVKGSLEESDGSIHEKKKNVPASEIEPFIMGVLPNERRRIFEKTP
ncbi:MAG TPA: toll/interleukin-1 receptor domain-containing protein [Thermoanaerobaculia bacterium]|nr:toll/interleukin-1 receptor domain-containing protein [Thermoanaerobaculia bacterium]